MKTRMNNQDSVYTRDRELLKHLYLCIAGFSGFLHLLHCKVLNDMMSTFVLTINVVIKEENDGCW